ncbi:MAG: hypothetical protein QM805_10605 [Pseudomonas sp.]
MSSRPLVRLLSALALTALPLIAAADAASDLLNVHQTRLAAQRSLGDFFMFNAMEGDQKYAKMVEASSQSATDALGKLGEMPGNESKKLKTELLDEWKAYASQLHTLTGALDKSGYTDLQPVADLAAQNRKLLDTAEQLYAKIQDESGSKVPPLTQQTREQSLLMQDIAVDYASRNASVGASFFGGGEERPLDDLANRFAINLVKLQQAPQTTPEIGQELRGVAIKWRYIEKSLQNYNQNSVPFLINKYSDRIIEDLEKVSGLYAAQQS